MRSCTPRAGARELGGGRAVLPIPAAPAAAVAQRRSRGASGSRRSWHWRVAPPRVAARRRRAASSRSTRRAALAPRHRSRPRRRPPSCGWIRCRRPGPGSTGRSCSARARIRAGPRSGTVSAHRWTRSPHRGGATSSRRTPWRGRSWSPAHVVTSAGAAGGRSLRWRRPGPPRSATPEARFTRLRCTRAPAPPEAASTFRRASGAAAAARASRREGARSPRAERQVRTRARPRARSASGRPRRARPEDKKQKAREENLSGFSGIIPAASYSPTRLPVQYHRLRRA